MKLEVQKITKNFGSKNVLRDINMTINPGEIHGLLGKNGAGKSTLINIISGVISEYQGSIIMDNQSIDNLNVKDRQNLGIYVVPQHAAIIPELNIAENLFLGMLPERKGVVQWKNIHNKAKEILKGYGVSYDTDTKVAKLPLLDQRKLNIIRAIFSEASLIILDEPTTALSSNDKDNLFAFINDLSNQGTSFIFISHYMEEILELCNTVTIIRDGKSFPNYSINEVNEDILTDMIVGDSVDLVERKKVSLLENNETLLNVENMSSKKLNNISYSMEKGEIVGVVGFPDSGAREFCRAIGGMHYTTGKMSLRGENLKTFKSPQKAIEKSIVYVSYDRHSEGIIPILPIRENINLSILNKIKTTFGVIKKNKDQSNAERYFKNLSVNATSPEEAVGNLSGGNQQKVVVAKALSVNPEVLILDEPTIGIDVKSREEILSVVNDLSDEGVGVLYLTNDYNELLRICDRVLFFHNGQIKKDIKNDNLEAEDIITLRDNIKEGETTI